MNRARDVIDRTDLAGLLTAMSGPPTGAGRNRRWHCIAADHQDDHPSVSIHVGSDGVERWKCWSDGRGGTVIDAVMAHRNVDAAAAIRELAGPDAITPPTRRRPDAPARRAEPFVATSEMLAWIESGTDRLWGRAGAEARNWLRARHLTDDTIRENRLGFSPGGRCDPSTGMPGGRGIVIPAFNPGGEVVSAQLRCWHGRTAKYLMPSRPQAPMPAVSFPVTGRVQGPVVVAEGLFDGLLVAQEGYRAAVLTSTATNLDHAAGVIVEFAGDVPVVLALDGDDAGRRATVGLQAALKALGCTPKVLQVPDGEDLTSIYRRTTTCQHHQPTSITR